MYTNNYMYSKKRGVMITFIVILLSLLVSIFLLLSWSFIIIVPLALVTGLLFSPIAIVVYMLFPELSRKYKKLKVLVADDDEISIAPLLAALAHRSVDVMIVKNGKRALSELKRKKVDLLFLDVMMPGLSGDKLIALGERILNSDHKIPVIFYTGHQQLIDNFSKNDLNVFRVEGVWDKTMSFASINKRLNQLDLVS